MQCIDNRVLNNIQGVHPQKPEHLRVYSGNCIANSIPSPDLFLISNKAGLFRWFIFTKQQGHKLLLLRHL
jgi:hypothetical protein